MKGANRRFVVACRAGDSDARELKALLESVGVEVLAFERRAHLIQPGQTYAIDTIKRMRRDYGDLVVKTALKVLVTAGVHVQKDVVQATVQLVYAFPLWASDEKALSSALSRLRIDKLREMAQKMPGNPGQNLALLMTPELSLALGRGR